VTAAGEIEWRCPSNSSGTPRRSKCELTASPVGNWRREARRHRRVEVRDHDADVVERALGGGGEVEADGVVRADRLRREHDAEDGVAVADVKDAVDARGAGLERHREDAGEVDGQAGTLHVSRPPDSDAVPRRMNHGARTPSSNSSTWSTTPSKGPFTLPSTSKRSTT
jgi:hypothetical protein